jgi:hypothetical protein
MDPRRKRERDRQLLFVERDCSREKMYIPSLRGEGRAIRVVRVSELEGARQKRIEGKTEERESVEGTSSSEEGWK